MTVRLDLRVAIMLFLILVEALIMKIQRWVVKCTLQKCSVNLCPYLVADQIHHRYSCFLCLIAKVFWQLWQFVRVLRLSTFDCKVTVAVFTAAIFYIFAYVDCALLLRFEQQ